MGVGPTDFGLHTDVYTSLAIYHTELKGNSINRTDINVNITIFSVHLENRISFAGDSDSANYQLLCYISY